MDVINLFPSPLWQFDLSDPAPDWSAARDAMLTRIYALAEVEKSVEKTNFGGWQSSDDLYQHAEFHWLLERIMGLANLVADQFSRTKKFDDGLLWANINRRGDFNAMHTHPDSILSGVVYLRYEREEQGIIEFFDAREGSPTTHWNCYNKLPDETPLTEGVHSVRPREGRMLFFPGWLKHWVTPNQTDIDRVSVSFNIRMN